ncbi:galectin-3b [Sphaeramia orbicularis]|uniref:galectin-3b n=1 Tax=Sphaeramia orbicularis TaxID=375764 RepID=UPI00117FF9A3|nr:galectin-3-like [Sphaeramia orbicularis]
MNLSDALDGFSSSGNQSGGGGGAVWPGQPLSGPVWPGQPPTNPVWSGGNPAQPSGPGGFPGPGPGGFPGPSSNSGPGSGGFPGPGSGGFPGPGSGGFPGPGSGGFPSPSPNSGPGSGGFSSPGSGGWSAPQQNLTVPFHQTLPNGVFNKLLITIEGTINANADKITVDLSTHRDLAFHFNPRFNEGGRQVIVRNSRIDQKWGKEERDLSAFPFAPGQSFELKILCTDTGFRVAVNNSHLLEYRHRIHDLRSITKLNIYYDLTLSKVRMETLP